MVRIDLQREVRLALDVVRAHWDEDPRALRIPPPRTMMRQTDDHRIRQVIDLLDRSPRLSIFELAAHVALSASRLEHLFKRETGITMRDFLCAHRLLRAAVLLIVTNLRIKEIAALTGYSCGQSLADSFAKQFGLCPHCYREQGFAPWVRWQCRAGAR